MTTTVRQVPRWRDLEPFLLGTQTVADIGPEHVRLQTA